MPIPRISLQALEAFERVAQSGSMQDTAAQMGLSISSVSHHIARLEDQMGVALFDRSSRPFSLTREGQQALQHLSRGLFHIRRATHETAVSGALGARSLRIGIVEEFESTVTPELAAFLTKQMPQATLSIRNILSHDAATMVQKGEIDLAIVSEMDRPGADTISLPLLRDPYVLALPSGVAPDPGALFSNSDDLAFLRFNQSHLIGKHIESHLTRNHIDLPHRFVFDSVQSIMAIIAARSGWSIITPLGFMRAQRFAGSVALHPLTLPAFARNIVLLSRDTFDDATRQALANLLRQIIEREVIVPACDTYPWLKGRLGP